MVVFKLQDMHAAFRDDATSFIDETTESGWLSITRHNSRVGRREIVQR
jgi:hypothetical protein